MAKHETTTYTCDFCEKQCEPVRALIHLHSRQGYGHYFNKIIFSVRGEIPYSGRSGAEIDVCRDCARDAMRAIVKQMDREDEERKRAVETPASAKEIA